MVKHRAFFYYFNHTPGVGILADNEREGWRRANLYAFGVDMDTLQRVLEGEAGTALITSGVLASMPAQSRVLIAGGVVFKGLTCLAGEGRDGKEVITGLEEAVPGFKVVESGAFRHPQSISPLEVYGFSYQGKVIGIARVVFFEYATQFSLAGIYRDQDRNLLDELYAAAGGLHAFMTVPNPLRTEERDQRVEVNMFMLRLPLKEELQAEFVQSISGVPGLAFYVA
ncbi:MAG: hypothetical protein H5T73_02760 [Actinobacteria bacterium]|nr:hypothetical protein [Actinomycetota bacterium]